MIHFNTETAAVKGSPPSNSARPHERWHGRVIAVAAALLIVAALPQRDAVAQTTPTLTISPSATVVGVNGSNRFFAVYYPTGPASSLPQYLDPKTVTWRVNRPWVLWLTDSSLGYGIWRGTATVTAKYQGLTATATVVVSGTVGSYSLVTPDGLKRTYTLYKPDSYRPGTPIPLVLAFHGRGGFDRGMMHVTQLDTVAYQKTFLVAYPNGTGPSGDLSWNGGGCCGYAETNQIDDVEFTRMMIKDISARYTVDPARVYATGLSNGAVFVHRLGFALSDKIAAIAPVAGGLIPGGDFIPAPPTRPMPVMEFHGTTDQMFPYIPAIPWTLLQWLNRNQITSAGVVSYQHGIETCETYTSTSTEVTLCTANPPQAIDVNGILYDGGGHVWPGGVKYNVSSADIPTYDINASASMWNFFAEHPME